MVAINKLDIQGLIIDMDGVLWRENEPIGDLSYIFKWLDDLELKYILASNNSTKTPGDYKKKLSQFGVQINEDAIINSSQILVNNLLKKYPEGGNVYIVGETGLIQLLENAGFFFESSEAIAVVAGMDRKFSYQKLLISSRLVRSGVEFLGTNGDLTFPTPDGLAPGAGSILAAITAASGKEPTILGKPNSEIFIEAMKRMEIDIDKTLVVGDRLETDIEGGQRLGCKTALVLSGVASQAQGYDWPTPPTIITTDLTELIESLI